ncbi:hypothetical protein C0992_010358 [Termitomyces sp. T32_za158]|nr:hypothetical protein C0992_010358 [Termitomyces sp. T32_za158]
MSYQDQLTENLWFLSKLYHSNPPDRSWVPEEHTLTLTILDAVANYLTTGQADSVIACYYQSAPATLILAKSGCVDDEDRSAVTQFLGELKAAHDWLDLLPFLAQRSSGQVNEKIHKLRTYFAKHCEDLCDAARFYQPGTDPSVSEFPGRRSRAFFAINDLNVPKPIEVPQTLIFILNLCNDYLTKNQEFGSSQDACIQFARLLYATRTLLDSQFLCTIRDPRLKRYLAELTQYLDIKHVIKFLRRLNGEIDIRWVSDVGNGTVKRVLDTATVGDRFKKSYVVNADLDDDTKDLLLTRMDRKFPGWRGDQEGPIQVTLYVHPEIRLFLDLIERNIVQDRDIVIGCSQKRCFACKLWIKKFEDTADMNLISNLDYGKPRFDWVHPDLPAAMRNISHLEADLNSYIQSEVDLWIKSTIGQETWEAFNICCDNKI